MSFGGQFDPDSEIERQFQEEIRRRQAAQQQQQQQQQYHHLSMLQGADPYNYAAAAAAARHYSGGPYGMPTGAADAYGDKASQVGALAQYYAAEQQRRAAAALQQQQQQQQQQGYRPQIHDPRWQMAAAAAASQYGAPSPYYARDAYALERQSSQQQQQQQQQQQSAAQPKPSPPPLASKPVPTTVDTPLKPAPSSSSAAASAIAAATAAATAQGGDEEAMVGDENGDEPISNFITYTKSGKPRKQRSPRVKELQELRTIMKKSVLHQHRQVDNEILDENNERKWFTGCVPLGLPDDKYWLSELQVFLRANFAEAFGATEDDIAAPMHGRNKPIALGQVGIRCMHCKSKYGYDVERENNCGGKTLVFFFPRSVSERCDCFPTNTLSCTHRRQSSGTRTTVNFIPKPNQWHLQFCSTNVASAL
eukprot:scaffold2760_cov167-Amphora_coffeaeformis.AAC.12